MGMAKLLFSLLSEELFRAEEDRMALTLTVPAVKRGATELPRAVRLLGRLRRNVCVETS